ncbi:MAG: hypothetical protein ACXVA9_09415 [Bdellovibrionales bacterium]
MNRVISLVVSLGALILATLAHADDCTTKDFQDFAQRAISSYGNNHDDKIIEAYVATDVSAWIGYQSEIFASWAALKIKDSKTGTIKQLILPMQGSSPQVDLVGGKAVYGQCTIDKEFPGAYFGTIKIK